MEEPEIQISPVWGLPGTLLAGEPVNVTCTSPGRCSGPPPQVTWTGPFCDTARNVSAQLANGTWAHRSDLRFTPTPVDDGKELICTVTYSPPQGPSTSRTIRLHVDLPDAWGAEGDVVSLETQEGDSLNLSCEASSRPESNLSWAKGNESLSPGQGGSGHLKLPNLSRGDAGEYRCWAKNSYGLASRVLRVDVQYSPRLGNRLNTSCQHQGPRVSCSCSLRSHPSPRLQWQVDGEPLAGNGSWGPLQVSSWAQGDEAVSTLSWTGSRDRGPQIFCLGSNTHRMYTVLLSPPDTGHPGAVMEAEGRTGQGPGYPRCSSPACSSGRSSATKEPTRNWNLTGLRKQRMRPQLGELPPQVRPTDPSSLISCPLPTLFVALLIMTLFAL
ncbi:sialic acid-binding Ig-like lectin 10 isoform X2 [Chrysemys picta bellii]|uniref:sialic acid-binding Ig-like lectin 10 isoform X2 n=1 Tax=Chrysemys picta bellii TaxID=8478 RepID=UPI0032B186EB